MTDFDHYHEWLGIPSEEQPPNHYRLLGIPLFEPSEKVISNAADRQMLFVRQFQVGEHLAESQALLNEIAGAKVCLLNLDSRATYDAHLYRIATPQTIDPPAFDSLITHPSLETASPTNKRSRQSQSNVRLLGHILAPIIGVLLGWYILLQIRPEASEPVVVSSPQSASSATIKESHARPVTPKHDPFDLKPDNSRSSGPNEPNRKKPEVRKNVDQPTAAPVVAKTEQIEALKKKQSEAVRESNLSAVMQATEALAVLEETDALAAKLDLLDQFHDKAEPSQFAEHCLSVLEAAVEKANKTIAERAGQLALVAARESKDSALVRRATLGVLRTQQISQSEGATP